MYESTKALCMAVALKQPNYCIHTLLLAQFCHANASAFAFFSTIDTKLQEYIYGHVIAIFIYAITVYINIHTSVPLISNIIRYQHFIIYLHDTDVDTTTEK